MLSCVELRVSAQHVIHGSSEADSLVPMRTMRVQVGISTKKGKMLNRITKGKKNQVVVLKKDAERAGFTWTLNVTAAEEQVMGNVR